MALRMTAAAVHSNIQLTIPYYQHACMIQVYVPDEIKLLYVKIF